MLVKEFNEQDLKVLLEALDSWEANAAMNHSMATLLTEVILPEEAKKDEKVKLKLKEADKKFEDTIAVRRETATLLKAKIVMLRQELAIERLHKEAK